MRVSNPGLGDELVVGSAGAPWCLAGRGLRERGEGEHFPWATFLLLQGRFALGAPWGQLSKDPWSAPQ